jgi:RNA polymerase sigma factor (sigma-70 family)
VADETPHAIGSQLRRLVGRRGGCPLTDAQLLEDFVARRDEAAFEALLWRHGGMVLGLCRRVLRHHQDAEDACQATFLVLARKAASIGRRQAVGPWLYRVAYRVALRLRARAARRAAREGPVDDLPAPDAADAPLWRDLRAVLDDALGRLPEKYRAPLVLCYLQGHTNEEAAALLGCPKGTVLSRLARGRERLRARLTRLGLALTAAGLAAALTREAAAAAPAAPGSSTAQAAAAFAAGHPAGPVPARVAALTEGVLRTMFLTRVKAWATALLALAAVGAGAGLWARHALADRPPPAAGAAEGRPADGQAPGPAGEETPWPDDVSGRVAAVAKDGKGFTLELPPKQPGGEPGRVEVKLDGKAEVVYAGVGTGGAKPTEGYLARVRLENGVRSVLFQGRETAGRRAADVAGKVTAVARDGKGVTVEAGPAGGGDGGREARAIDLRFDDRTVVLFNGVAPGRDRLTEGYEVRAWLEDGPKGGTAAVVHVNGKDQGPPRRKDADVTGVVVAVGAGGKSITVAVPAGGAGKEPQKVEVLLADRTAAAYYDVPAGGARPAPGQQAGVWLEEGSGGVAAAVSLIAPRQERWARVEGKVVGVSADGKTITLEAPPGAGGGVPKRTAVKLTDRTQVAYYGVGPGEARPAEGYTAQVELADGSEEVARTALFTKPGAGRGR